MYFYAFMDAWMYEMFLFMYVYVCRIQAACRVIEKVALQGVQTAL